MKLFRFIFVFVLISCSSDDSRDSDPNLANDVDFFSEGELQVLFENDPNGIDIVFLGDGYIKEELGKVFGDYRLDAERHINYLMNTFPFSEFQQYFNAYIIYAESEDILENTAFDVQYNGSDNDSNNPTNWDSAKINQYINNAFPNQSTTRITMLSVNQRGGGRALIGGGLAVFGSFSENTMVHEIGHAFGGLGDEYYFDDNFTPFEATIFPNLDNTNEIDQVKWKHFIGLPSYSNVSVFEGGGYTPQNVWRPENKSIMGGGISSNYADYFNAPSREAIVKRIFIAKNLNYDFNDFLAIDTGFSTRSIHNRSSKDTVFNCGNAYRN